MDRADTSVWVEVSRGQPGRVEGDADIARTAALFADPARVRVLLALADGRALAASVLAAEARLSAQGVSAHLAKLRSAGLVVAEKSGRHRFYRLAGPETAELLETLARCSPSQPVTSLREGTRAEALRTARTCYDHLAGRLGVAVTSALLAGVRWRARPTRGGVPWTGFRHRWPSTRTRWGRRPLRCSARWVSTWISWRPGGGRC